MLSKYFFELSVSLDELEFVEGERLFSGARSSGREACSAGARNPVCCCHDLAGGCAGALCVQGRRRAALPDASSEASVSNLSVV